jgi:hypothetical protein
LKDNGESETPAREASKEVSADGNDERNGGVAVGVESIRQHQRQFAT